MLTWCTALLSRLKPFNCHFQVNAAPPHPSEFTWKGNPLHETPQPKQQLRAAEQTYLEMPVWTASPLCEDHLCALPGSLVFHALLFSKALSSSLPSGRDAGSQPRGRSCLTSDLWEMGLHFPILNHHTHTCPLLTLTGLNFIIYRITVVIVYLLTNSE